jgi:hypothetical protein
MDGKIMKKVHCITSKPGLYHGLRLLHSKSQSGLVELARILICANETEDSGIDAWYGNLFTGRPCKPPKQTNENPLKPSSHVGGYPRVN